MAERSYEETRRRVLVIRGVTLLVVAAIGFLGWAYNALTDDPEPNTSAGPESSPTSSKHPGLTERRLSSRLELTSRTVESGSALSGRVVVQNDTGRPVNTTMCGSFFRVALASPDYEPEISWPLCAAPFTIPTGESSYAVTVQARHLGCNPADPPPPGQVTCTADGPPPLPPGDYEATIYQSEDLMPGAAPIGVRVI